MKKSKIIAAILFLAMFSSIFVVAKTYKPIITTNAITTPDISDEPSVEPKAWTPKPLGNKGIWIYNNTGGGAITLDGDLSDWATLPGDVFGGVTVYLAYDASNVYVACTWQDSTEDDALSHWNKTGMLNGSAVWEQLAGADDMLAIGFDNGTYKDTWVWTRSIRTDGAHAYEPGDAGTEPFLRNADVNITKPIYDNSTTPIVDDTVLPNGTVYVGWFAQAPTGSQTDVSVAYSYNATGQNMYVVEFSRALDTGNPDDIVLNFTDLTGQSFFVGAANKQDCLSMDVATTAFSLAEGNDVATLTFDIIPNADSVDSALLIHGTVYDDYDGWELIVYLNGWAYTYGPGAYDYADVNLATGNWSYLFFYDQWDMPLGDDEVHVAFYPKYEAPIHFYQNVTIVDKEAPQILGIVDLAERYPDGVSINETTYVTVTVGLQDNYWERDDIEAHLYSYKDTDVALMTPMVHFDPYGTTFSANITITYTPGAPNEYTYFVDAFDPVLNKVLSEKFYFKVVAEVGATPGFGFIAAIVGLLGASVIIYKKYKK
ncbi:MAG: hypothetical protein K9W42_13280 [Candidatus Heimdallarchaeota archaeon]|nr:hypothetical protein [Candidatus Heimdallarchaeota archaeon]